VCLGYYYYNTCSTTTIATATRCHVIVRPSYLSWGREGRHQLLHRYQFASTMAREWGRISTTSRSPVSRSMGIIIIITFFFDRYRLLKCPRLCLQCSNNNNNTNQMQTDRPTYRFSRLSSFSRSCLLNPTKTENKFVVADSSTHGMTRSVKYHWPNNVRKRNKTNHDLSDCQSKAGTKDEWKQRRSASVRCYYDFLLLLVEAKAIETTHGRISYRLRLWFHSYDDDDDEHTNRKRNRTLL